MTQTRISAHITRTDERPMTFDDTKRINSVAARLNDAPENESQGKRWTFDGETKFELYDVAVADSQRFYSQLIDLGYSVKVIDELIPEEVRK